ncbi:unnamed protein product [Cuscuta europaea]|uniref:LIM zinc-binding domain-containing protein n=1 Tax=Cuscuta europaea TaxID=41803 RepID=A0A9P0Z7P8_CUSEU|nr:unnamed protein product [Cuscuta europaea]
MSGSLDKSFEGAPKIVREGTADQGHSRTKVSSMFVGTQDKCVGCNKTVYPIEKGDVDGTSYHPPYFKCSHGGCVISPSNYVANDHKIYCRHHHTQLFMEKGNFSQLDTSINLRLSMGTSMALPDRFNIKSPLAWSYI